MTQMTNQAQNNMIDVAPLSKREFEVVETIALGSSTKEAAEQLFVSTDTVASHRKNAYRKLGINRETELCKWYFSRRFGFEIDLKPLFKILSAVFLLAVLGLGELAGSDDDMIRVRCSARSRVSRTRKEN